jgi:hypothetical protein
MRTADADGFVRMKIWLAPQIGPVAAIVDMAEPS